MARRGRLDLPELPGEEGAGSAPANPAERVGLDDPARPGESQVFRSSVAARAAAGAEPARVSVAGSGAPLSSATTAVPVDAEDDEDYGFGSFASPTDPGIEKPKEPTGPTQVEAPKRSGMSRLATVQNAVIAAIASALLATNWDGISRVVLEKTNTLSGLLEAYRAISAEKENVQAAYEGNLAWIDETWEPGEMGRIASEREEKLADIQARQEKRLAGVESAVSKDIEKIKNAADNFRGVVSQWDRIMQGKEGSPDSYKETLAETLNGRNLPGYDHIVSASDAYLTLDDEGVYDLDLSVGADGVKAQAAAQAERVESAILRLQTAKEAAYVSINDWEQTQLANMKSAGQRRATIINEAVAARKGVDTWEQGQLDALAAGKLEYQGTFAAERDEALAALPGLLNAQVGSKGMLVDGFLGEARPVLMGEADCLEEGEKADPAYCGARAKSILDCDDPANDGLVVAEVGCENRYAEYLTAYACGVAAPEVADQQAWMDSRVLTDGYTMAISPRTLCERAQKGTWAVDAVK